MYQDVPDLKIILTTKCQMILQGGHAINHNISGGHAPAKLVPFPFVANPTESFHSSVEEPVTVNVF